MVVLGEITGTRENMGRSKKTILNIDIGGTKIRANFGGKLQKWNTPRTKKEFAKILEKLPRADAVGIGVAGVISGTRVIKSPNIRYLKNFDFREIFPKVVLRIDNDARVFLGERIGRFGGRRILAFTIGTGIGRAYGEGGKVKMIKKFEYPVSWEKEYQKIRDSKDDRKLAEYLGKKLSVLIKKYKPETVILGGGVLKKKGFYRRITKELRVKTHV